MCTAVNGIILRGWKMEIEYVVFQKRHIPDFLDFLYNKNAVRQNAHNLDVHW